MQAGLLVSLHRLPSGSRRVRCHVTFHWNKREGVNGDERSRSLPGLDISRARQRAAVGFVGRYPQANNSARRLPHERGGKGKMLKLILGALDAKKTAKKMAVGPSAPPMIPMPATCERRKGFHQPSGRYRQMRRLELIRLKIRVVPNQRRVCRRS